MRLRKFSLPGLAVTLGTFALLASGCGGSSGPTGPANLAKDQVFNIAYSLGGSSDITTFDPNQTTDVVSIFPINNVFEGMVTLDKNLAVEAWDAKSWDVSSDGLTYTFHLRDGLAFSDGTPVTAQDFAYSMDRALNPCVASAVSYYLYPIKDATTFNNQTCKNLVITNSSGPVINTLIGDSLNVVDPKTLKITLQQPAAYFLEALTYPTSYAIEKKVVDASGDITNEKWLDTLKTGTTGQGGSGMFYVSSWDHSTGIKLKANPHWWGITQGKKPYLSEIDYTFFKDADTAYSAYQAGQFDYGVAPSSQRAQAKTQSDYTEYGTLTYYGINMNWQRPPFNNLDARLAMCEAIDRNQLNTAILKGAVTPHWNIVPKGMPGYNANLTGPDGITSPSGDVTKAKAHWQTYLGTLAGGKVPAINYLYVSSSGSAKKLAEAIQAQWSQNLGVTVNVKGEDFSTYLHDSDAGNFDIERFGWIADYPDPQDFLTLLFSSSAQYNSQKAKVPEADTLMTQADANPNQSQRLQQYNQAEQLLVNNVSTCPLYQSLSWYQLRAKFHNYFEDAQGLVPLDNYVSMYVTNS